MKIFQCQMALFYEKGINKQIFTLTKPENICKVSNVYIVSKLHKWLLVRLFLVSYLKSTIFCAEKKKQINFVRKLNLIKKNNSYQNVNIQIRLLINKSTFKHQHKNIYLYQMSHKILISKNYLNYNLNRKKFVYTFQLIYFLLNRGFRFRLSYFMCRHTTNRNQKTF